MEKIEFFVFRNGKNIEQKDLKKGNEAFKKRLEERALSEYYNRKVTVLKSADFE